MARLVPKFFSRKEEGPPPPPPPTKVTIMEKTEFTIGKI